MDLSGRHIVVTGAGQGIGRAIALACAQLGARLTLVGRGRAALESTVAALPADTACIVTGDVADEGLAASVLAEATARFGRIHGLVNNAGISQPAMLAKLSNADWHRVLDVNLSGSFYLLQALGRHFIEQHAVDGMSSSIVNISSDAGRRGTIGQANYAASKAALMGLTMSAAREWGRYAIRVNTVSYGFVDTPMTKTVKSEKFLDYYLKQIPLGRISTPEEVTPPVCFLLSNAASYITGQHLSVNGGMHIGY